MNCCATQMRPGASAKVGGEKVGVAFATAVIPPGKFGFQNYSPQRSKRQRVLGSDAYALNNDYLLTHVPLPVSHRKEGGHWGSK